MDTNGTDAVIVCASRQSKNDAGDQIDDNWRPTRRPAPLPPRITDEEAAAHKAFVEALGDGAVWNSFDDA